MEGISFILRLLLGLVLVYLVLGQTCERYWLLHEETCFRHFSDHVSYLEAKKQCTSARAQLLANLTDGLEDRLLGQTQAENSSYWCKTEGDMFSMPGLILERKKRSTSCCYIRNMEYEKGECDELRGYICEKEPIPRIHVCMQNTTISSNVSNWESARRYCQCNGGDLYSFNDTTAEEHFLQLARDRDQNMWIGLRREAHSNEFLWSDGTPFIHSIWSAGQSPRSDDNSKLCVAYIAENATWGVIDCSSELSFMCRASENTYDTDAFFVETTTETTPYHVSVEDTTMETDTYSVFYTVNITETTTYDVSSEDAENETAIFDVSSEEAETETGPSHFTYNNSETETTLGNISTDVPTTETEFPNVSIENSTAETGHMSACYPVFKNCYIAGVVIGVIILLTTGVIAAIYLRYRKKKESNEEVPVELVNVNSYKEDIPAKLLAAKIKEVIA